MCSNCSGMEELQVIVESVCGFDTTEGAFVPGLLSRIERFDSASLDVTCVLRA